MEAQLYGLEVIRQILTKNTRMKAEIYATARFSSSVPLKGATAVILMITAVAVKTIP